MEAIVCRFLSLQLMQCIFHMTSSQCILRAANQLLSGNSCLFLLHLLKSPSNHESLSGRILYDINSSCCLVWLELVYRANLYSYFHLIVHCCCLSLYISVLLMLNIAICVLSPNWSLSMCWFITLSDFLLNIFCPYSSSKSNIYWKANTCLIAKSLWAGSISRQLFLEKH